MATTVQLPENAQTFGVFEALMGRRSRRFGRGMSIPDGPLAYTSTSEPQPLSEAERALLVFAATGVTGWNLGMPHTSSGPPESGANYPMRHVGRTAPSAAGIESSELLVADDSGSYISQTRNAPVELIEAAAAATSLDELVKLSAESLVKLSDERLQLPASPPHIAAHNRWSALAPGSTLLLPIIDMTEQLLDFLSIFTGEGVIIWDAQADEPIGDPTALSAAGVLHPEARMPIEAFERLVYQQGTSEAAIIAYNAQLALQAMGLGGWLFGGMDAASLLGAHASSGVPGFGFDFAMRPEWGVPNPLGRRDVFETLAAPYVTSTAQAVERFAARKFGATGIYDLMQSGPYRDNPGVKGRIQRYDDATLVYFVSVLDGLESRFGRYPGTMPTVLTSMYVQAQHVDEEYYAKFHHPDALLHTHRAHQEAWHPEG